MNDAKFGLITLLYNRRKALRIPIVVAIPNHGLVLSDQKHSFITKVMLKVQALATRQAHHCRDSIGVSGGILITFKGAPIPLRSHISFSLKKNRCHADCDR